MRFIHIFCGKICGRRRRGTRKPACELAFLQFCEIVDSSRKYLLFSIGYIYSKAIPSRSQSRRARGSLSICTHVHDLSFIAAKTGFSCAATVQMSSDAGGVPSTSLPRVDAAGEPRSPPWAGSNPAPDAGNNSPRPLPSRQWPGHFLPGGTIRCFRPAVLTGANRPGTPRVPGIRSASSPRTPSRASRRRSGRGARLPRRAPRPAGHGQACRPW